MGAARRLDPTPDPSASPTPSASSAPSGAGAARFPAIVPVGHVDQLRQAREILRAEAAAVEALVDRLDVRFCLAIDLILACRGRVIVTGMGKAGHIGSKLAATLSSTGTPAHALHPAEAVHGDLGAVQPGDLVIGLSNSGETDEVCRLLPILQANGATLLAITATETSTLGQAAAVTLEIGQLREADANGLAPSTTTTAMLALGDALALTVSRCRGFTPEQFAVFHPGGSLGRKLSSVADVMRPLEQCRCATVDATVRDVFTTMHTPGRRTGAVLLLDADEALVGLFTDSDLARLLGNRDAAQLDVPIRDVMTTDPLVTTPETPVGDVVETLQSRKISELPVVAPGGRPLGIVDITDVIGLLPVPDAA